jgi:acyl-CoA reductase-like NAD-dependent aldehyde dehydrogenase
MAKGENVADRLQLIDGSFEAGAAASLVVVDPATGTPIDEVPTASSGQVDRAVAAAARAQTRWWKSPQQERTDAMHAIAQEIRRRTDDIADIVTRETGRPYSRNLLYVDMIANLFRQYGELARVHGGRVAPSNDPGQLSFVVRVPYGVVATLVPWNYPLLLLAFKVAPALATGNTVVIKPASETALTTLVLAEVFQATTPPGVVNVVVGSGRTVGEQLVGHPGTDMVAFTGSTEVGIRIGQVCAEMTKPAHLELGGKDPAIVFGDVSPELAAKGVVWASFLNAGQVCTSTERVYVQEGIYDRFLEAAVEITADLRVGDPFDAATQIGPLRNEAARTKVMEQLLEAEELGAKIVTGGDIPSGSSGFYLRPTVVADVNHDMSLMREETFGPVLPIMRFREPDEAFALAADTPYGLGVSIYTHDAALVGRAYEELQVGTVWVNDPVVDNLAAPFGGMRASGNARELGLEGMESFTAARHVHWNLDLEDKPWWYGKDKP